MQRGKKRAVLIWIAFIVHCGCTESKLLHPTMLSDLHFPDVEIAARKDNQLVRQYVSDSNERKLGYFDYDSLGRLKYAVSLGFMSSTTFYAYDQYPWPSKEVRQSDIRNVLITEHVYLPQTKSLLLVKYSPDKNGIVNQISIYQFGENNRLQSTSTMNVARQDSVATVYEYSDNQLVREYVRVTAKPGSIASTEIREGLLATETSTVHYYSGDKLDSTLTEFHFQPNGSYRRECIVYDSAGLRKNLILQRSFNKPPDSFFYQNKFR